MPAKTNLEREELIERVEELLAMGFTTPTEIMRNLQNKINDFETAKIYLDIARRRQRNKYTRYMHLNKIRRRELASLDIMEKKAWIDYSKATPSARPKTLNVIIGIKERRAKMCGIDAPQKFWGAMFTKDVDSLKENKLSVIEVDELAKKLMRIKDELSTGQEPSEPDEEEAGVEGAAPIRTDIPPALPASTGSPIPPTDSGSGQAAPTGDSGSA